MKTALIVLTVLIAAAAGYYFLMPTSTPLTETETPTTTGAQGKIDINAVCDGALAYMSFKSGEEADAWVQACKRGERPEAIEQWKVQMGITDDRAL